MFISAEDAATIPAIAIGQQRSLDTYHVRFRVETREFRGNAMINTNAGRFLLFGITMLDMISLHI